MGTRSAWPAGNSSPATQTCDCDAPGLSTRVTLLAATAGKAGRFGSAPRRPFQAASFWSSSFFTSAALTSPDTETMAVFGS